MKPSSRARHYQASVKTPFAHLALVLNEDELVAIDFISQNQDEIAPGTPAGKHVVSQIKAYLTHRIKNFDVKLDVQGTSFQQKVWRELQKIPFGKVRTYGELASALNTSPRAVGNACRHNPVPLIVPCHRVVSACGLGGYSGTTSGKLHNIKRTLLQHEGVDIA